MSRDKKNNNNLIKLKRKAKVDSTVIVFAIILLYVAVVVIMSFMKEPIPTYKVGSSNINSNISCTGIALRNEIEITSGKSGYMIYFVHDGDKIKKNAPVCSVDETGNVISAIQATGEGDEGNALFTKNDYVRIRSSIDSYKSAYNDVTFSDLYNFKSEIESKVMELSSEVMLQQINIGGAQVSSTIQTIKASESGVITYYTDGYESKTPETLSIDDFTRTNYKKNSLKSGDILESGSTVFKIVSDENWSIVCKITKKEADAIQKEERVRFTINDSPNDVSSTYRLIPKEDDTYFLVLSLSKYMVEYIDDRFLNIEIILNKFEGLKVPNSSLLEKEVYKIPKEYINESPESVNKTVTVRRYESDDNDINKGLKNKATNSDADKNTNSINTPLSTAGNATGSGSPSDASIEPNAVVSVATSNIPDEKQASTMTDAVPVKEPVLPPEGASYKNQKITLIVYKSDDNYYYVDEDSFHDTDQIYTDNKQTVEPVLSLARENLTGVYLANAGVANFIEVSIVKSQDEFTIVKKDENLKEFDIIVLDYTQVKENQSLY